ncbi:cytochrome c oxidase subunit II [Roseomonas marmotae]|uniref:cytochrome-c oxidase n=1 Tax=Roseomonas marmotae TaxID=2768161 RepID=A0ABS3KDG2_9PROT|nr:cytochrome c oxidase subunit II [Roseomonas marmotae]MBO1075504.1 cytochrome c oxidase subunit II [Roseomonas marmotae]QTI81448.1 cytochrome c oxidase subunit II [Roseomonas marmotae]
MTTHRIPRAIASLAPLLSCAGCSGWQSVLAPGADAAQRLDGLFWLFTITCAAVWAAVMLVLAAALWRRRRQEDRRAEGRAGFFVGAAVAATVLIVSGLTLASYFTTRGIAADPPDALVVRLRGYQWWWEVTYADPAPDRAFVTANELRLPLGRPVRLELAAADVIHSFWVPNLAGKQDMIPGRDNTLVFTPHQAGTFRAQCAEFCGLQHARMALRVVVEPPEAFERWRETQLAEATPPRTPEEEAGRRVLEEKACAACHTVRGTAAAGTLGPDLTHVGGRQTIAAGMLPTTRGSLAAWIADPQTIKPGNNMPMVPLTAGELHAVSAYLTSLK